MTTTSEAIDIFALAEGTSAYEQRLPDYVTNLVNASLGQKVGWVVLKRLETTYSGFNINVASEHGAVAILLPGSNYWSLHANGEMAVRPAWRFERSWRGDDEEIWVVSVVAAQDVGIDPDRVEGWTLALRIVRYRLIEEA
jgi:hypothetical protein